MAPEESPLEILARKVTSLTEQALPGVEIDGRYSPHWIQVASPDQSQLIKIRPRKKEIGVFAPTGMEVAERLAQIYEANGEPGYQIKKYF